MFNQIAEARRKAGLSQDDLAQALSTSRQNVGRWERGESDIKGETLLKIAEATGCSLNFLFGVPDSSQMLGSEEKEIIELYNSLGRSDRWRVNEFCRALLTIGIYDRSQETMPKLCQQKL